MERSEIESLSKRIKENVSKVIVGKGKVIDRLLIAMICSGHVLLEDVPGTGKTLLAKSMAKSLAVQFKRIQFTPDLLPADLSGINYFNQKSSEFEFRPGPLFTNILLADEINRATPRTQSSLLECMEERQVTIDGETRGLTRPFLVIATQNPIESQGTFPLPEAQLDRFLLRIRMGYPETEEALEILQRFKQSNPLEQLQAVAQSEEIIEAQQHYSDIFVSDSMLAYIVDIVERTRKHDKIANGVSPRGSQALLKTAQAYAVIQGRDYVAPDDVKAMAVSVLAHRIVLKQALRVSSGRSEELIEQILQNTPVPTEDDLQRKLG